MINLIISATKFRFIDSFLQKLSTAYLKSKGIDTEVFIEKALIEKQAQVELFRVVSFKELGLPAPRIEKMSKN